MPSTRQLAAILFTDIAGYTAMMQKDEAAALAVVRQYTGVLAEIVSAHQGTIVNSFCRQACLPAGALRVGGTL